MYTRKIRPDYKVFSFSSLDKVDPSKIAGNAILLVGMRKEVKQIKVFNTDVMAFKYMYEVEYSAHTYLIKNRKLILKNNQPQSYEFTCKDRPDINDAKYTDIVNRQDTYTEINCSDRLFLCFYRVAHHDAYQYVDDPNAPPYLRVSMDLSKNGKHLIIKKTGHRDQPLLAEDDYHPFVRQYLHTSKNHHDTLTLLYKMQASREFSGYTISHHVKSFLTNYWSINLDKAIKLFQEGNGYSYLSFDEFKSKVSNISKRFSSSTLTTQKTSILNNFIYFYNENKNNPDYMPRHIMVERWIDTYIDSNNENPFEVLNRQRRTGCLSFFNPSKTDSILLFENFLSGEILPSSLQGKMQPSLPKNEISQSEKKNHI